jgi:hypothetical protein
MVTVSFGLGEGANRALKHAAQGDRTPRERDDDWQQAVLGYQDGTLMMAVVRVVEDSRILEIWGLLIFRQSLSASRSPLMS